MNKPERVDDLARAVSGNMDALQRLIVHCHSDLRNAVTRAVPPAHRRRVDPDDVLQQAYISVFACFAGLAFDDPHHFYQWLRRIALNQLKDAQRAAHRQKRDIARELPDRPDPAASYPDIWQRLAATDPTPSRSFAQAEATAAVMTCLARLADEQRDVIRMRIIEDLPVAEIARRLGKSEVAIYALTRRGLKSLRELMGPITQYLSRL